ncbi:hypothetical protein ILYODFUR_001940 [Ilyodon furcidens]|uniref:Secreted protein n=1 Tax=Ilyodon furcidens TaxID=33524 RepID=A0ABV0SIG8_9TELE
MSKNVLGNKAFLILILICTHSWEIRSALTRTVNRRGSLPGQQLRFSASRKLEIIQADFALSSPGQEEETRSF